MASAPDRAHRAGLGRNEQAAVEAADDEQEQQQRRPDFAKALSSAPRQELARPGGQEAGRTRSR